MKTQSGSIKLAMLVTVAVIAAITLRGFAQSASKPPPSQEKFVLTINSDAALKDASANGEKAFKDLLNTPGKYPKEKGNKIHMKHSSGGADECLPTGAVCSSKLDIQTDKVTVSETAKNIASEELTLIQPHVTIQIASSSADDVAAVLAKLGP